MSGKENIKEHVEASGVETLSQSMLLEIYKATVDEQYRCIEGHQHRVKWFLGVASAIIAGTVAGSFKASLWSHYGILLVGPILIASVAEIGLQASFFFHRKQMEVTSSRCKIEASLGLTKSRNNSDHWAESEPLVAPRHLENQNKFKSSGDWLDYALYSSPGVRKRFVWLFRGLQALAFALFIFLGYLLLNPPQEPDKTVGVNLRPTVESTGKGESKLNGTKEPAPKK